MESVTVVQEVAFDLATNTAIPTKWTGFGIFGRPVPEGGIVSPQAVYGTIHPEDLSAFAAHLESLYLAKPGETRTVVIRCRHACGDYVDVTICGRLEEATESGVGRLVRSTLTWRWPEGQPIPAYAPPGPMCLR